MRLPTLFADLTVCSVQYVSMTRMTRGVTLIFPFTACCVLGSSYCLEPPFFFRFFFFVSSNAYALFFLSAFAAAICDVFRSVYIFSRILAWSLMSWMNEDKGEKKKKKQK
jgi:hypothetical protein